MITVTSAQLDAWLALLSYPLARVLGLFAIAPVFGGTGVPKRIRVLLGLAVALVLTPSLGDVPNVSPGSWTGTLILARETLIGLLLGFTLRIAMSAVDVAGELIGLQMGLSFAVFYDPQNSGQSPVLSEFLSLLTTLMFLAMNGHLLILSTLAETYRLLPISVTPISAQGLSATVAWAAVLFSSGLLLSLPVIAALLITNIAMGVLARVAPQLNLFAVGFPVTIMAGFAVLTVSLPYFGAALEHLFDQAFAALHTIVNASAA